MIKKICDVCGKEIRDGYTVLVCDQLTDQVEDLIVDGGYGIVQLCNSCAEQRNITDFFMKF